MRLLLISDEESPLYWDHFRPELLEDVDLILAAGDLKSEYLTFLATMGRAPLVYVHGNHDAGYRKHPPEGCVCADGDLVTVKGLRILGLGGCLRYNRGPLQYTEEEMARRIRRLRWKLFRAGGADVLLTHAPAEGIGDDGDDPAHRGFRCFLRFMDRYRPRLLVHGHVHPRYGSGTSEVLKYGETEILNACGCRVVEI